MAEVTYTTPYPLVSLGELARFIPEPKNSLGNGTFAKVLGAGLQVASSLGGAALGISGSDYGALLSMQMQMQQEMLEVNLKSNVMKTQHETAMAPVRNIRA